MDGLDAAQLRQAVRISGIDSLALTKLDVLDGFESIELCVGYELDGVRVDHLPASLDAQSRAKPVYERFDGWRGTVKGYVNVCAARRRISLRARRSGRRRTGIDDHDRRGSATTRSCCVIRSMRSPAPDTSDMP